MLTALSTGSSEAKPSGTAKAIPQDAVLQLLHTAVYSAAEDPQRQSSIQQLARMVPRLQQPPGSANDIATFSTRWVRHILGCCYHCTSLAWHVGACSAAGAALKRLCTAVCAVCSTSMLLMCLSQEKLVSTQTSLYMLQGH